MNDIVLIARLGNFDEVIFVNKNDIQFIGKQRAMEVMCIRVDMNNKTIDAPTELEKHFKFNPWEEIARDEEKKEVMDKIISAFGDKVLSEKILTPLEISRVKP